jgi:hypothetical protein
VQNGRQNLLRSARECGDEGESAQLRDCALETGTLLSAMQHALNRGEDLSVDEIRGYEGQAASVLS